MEIKGNIVFDYKTEKDAKLIFDSLEVDNKNFIESELHNSKINYNIVSKTLGSFLTTVDDLISSEIVSEKIIGTDKE